MWEFVWVFFSQVKVAFGDVWKETLSELSGGQRSLVALSLILSLLLFKPAPLYILVTKMLLTNLVSKNLRKVF